MTTPATPTTARSVSTAAPPWRTGLLAGLGGGLAATAVGLAGLALDVPMVVSQPDGASGAVPLGGYLIATLVATTIGTGIAALLLRRAARPARIFLALGVVGTLASLAQPSLAADDTATAVVLVLSHIAAAAVVLPLLTRHLQQRTT